MNSDTFIYYTHDNEGRPFKVILHEEWNKTHYATVYRRIDSEDENRYESKPIYETTYLQSYVGSDDDYRKRGQQTRCADDREGLYRLNPGLIGNSILLCIKGNIYVYIGEQIYAFQIDGPLVDYISYIGGSDVAYPVVTTAKSNYLLLEGIKLSVDLYNPEKDCTPYDAYYAMQQSKDTSKAHYSHFMITPIAEREW